MSENTDSAYLMAVRQWIEQVVIGLNFCPFARKPFEEKRVSIVVDHATQDDAILEVVLKELLRLENTSASELETTLIVLPEAYPDFMEFNSLLYVLNDVLEMEGFEGIFQIASFHPHYQFAGTQAQDRENFTNRAPYPILHLIREDSVEQVLALHPDPDNIPNTNIQRLNQLSDAQLKAYFSYLF
jgi:hypothetical protein